MSLIDNPTLKLLEHVLGYRDQRQDLITANIANANTPGYKPFDLVLDQTLATDSESPVHRSVRVGGAARLDGNAVSLDDEFVKMTENRMMYQAALELYDRWAGLNGIAREIR